ncbi:hypothetical protein Tco_1152764 [Tanacetum coccineum]
MGTPTQFCVWSCPNFSAPAGRPFRWERVKRVGKGGRVEDLREGNDDRAMFEWFNGNDQGLGANGGVEGVNRNIEGANRGAPDFSTIIAR